MRVRGDCSFSVEVGMDTGSFILNVQCRFDLEVEVGLYTQHMLLHKKLVAHLP